ncbi:uncharacterized protein LOC125071593 [Vanessa atalanta]|uniref:uncharacterized protein LOC125071593 n=1 Tax=Vanessa atalanta TaxID=42275 RepID=UPI001FCDC0E4|nr:uncharacterized protein LOC125071593 [Vanessa atalanta]
MEENTAQDCRISAEVDLAAISVQSRILPFWRDLPRSWFIQFEVVVDPLKTSDDQRFRYVLQQLQTTDLQHVTDILYETPATEKYNTLKNRLLAVYEKSDVKNFQKLISGLQLGDQKPSQLLRKMRELSSGMITNDGLRIEWLNHLPTQVRVVLSVNTESSLDTLAAMADKMVEYSEPTTIAAISTSTPTNDAVSTQFAILTKQLEKLSLEINEIRGRSKYRRQSRQHYRSQSRSRPSSSYRNKSAVKPGDATWECKYHYRFGDKAKRCESPCCRRMKKDTTNHLN